MVLDSYRSSADRYLVPIANRLSFLNPNTLSWIAFLMAIIAGAFFYGVFFFISSKDSLLFGALFVFLNAFLDALDGKIAKIANTASPRGDFLDHVLDRYADVFIIGGIMFGPYCRGIIGVLAVLAVLLASYMGTQAQAVGAKRDYAGILGRADRLAILSIMPIVQYVLIEARYPALNIGGWAFTLVELAMIWFIVAGNITAIQRAASTWKELR